MNKTERAIAMAKRFIDDKDIICFNDHFYLFNEGIWRLESDENTEAWITTEYIKTYAKAPMIRDLKEIKKYITSFTYDKYRKKIKYLSENHIENTINVKSGILNLDTLKIKPYKKDDFCFHKLPFDFKESPKCPVLMKFLTSSMNYDLNKMKTEDIKDYKQVIKFIQEWMGYSMIGGNKLHKSLIMVGEGRNGKGVLQSIWETIIGEYNCSYVDLKYLNDGSQIFLTQNKLVNFCSDLEAGQQLDTGIIKSFIAGEKVISNEKYKGQIPIQATCKLVIACNDLPYIKNAGAAIKQRFFILPFDKIFEEHEQDRELSNKLKEEAENIFSWAVNGYRNLKERGNFDVPVRCEYSSDEYLKSHDNVRLWIEENNVERANSEVERKHVYNDYVLYCKDSNLIPLGKQKFYKKLEKRGFELKVLNGIWYFKGLALPNQTIL